MAPVLAGLPFEYSIHAQRDAARVFDRWNLPYKLVPPLDWCELQYFGAEILQTGNVSLVLAGTSWGPSIDKAVTLAARQRSIKVAAIVEHWDLYMERFSEVQNGRIVHRGCFLPDRIWVNDALARDEAVEAGLPSLKIDVLGQPHLECMLEQYGKIQLKRDDRSIVFISERVNGDFAQGSPLDRGFDEFIAVRELIKSLNFARHTLTIKLHPQEPAGKFDSLIGLERGIIVLKDADNASLICGAGKVVGMFSMMLLEAALIRDDVISFLPGGLPSVFVGNRIGATRAAINGDELRSLINLKSEAKSGNADAVANFGLKFVGSIERMTDQIGTYLQ
jgi:hypothetical protein